LSEKKINKLEIDLYFLNGYATRYLESYRIAASLYNMSIRDHQDLELNVNLKTYDGDQLLKQLKDIIPKKHYVLS
jgi:hypothetical protein